MKLAEAGVTFEDISGNHDIVVSIVGAQGADPGTACGMSLFASTLVSDPGQQRWVQRVAIADLGRMPKECGRTARVEHVFDY